jgi:hypothetical protein
MILPIIVYLSFYLLTFYGISTESIVQWPTRRISRSAVHIYLFDPVWYLMGIICLPCAMPARYFILWTPLQKYSNIGLLPSWRMVLPTGITFTLLYLASIIVCFNCYNITLGQVITFITSFMNPSAHTWIEFVNAKQMLFTKLKAYCFAT